MTDYERFKAIIRHINKPINSIAKEIGVSQPSLKSCVDGNNNPSFDTIQKLILKYPEINSNWLLSGKGEMLLNDETKMTEKKVVTDILNNSKKINFLYQKIIDVSILLKEHSGEVFTSDNYTEIAADILNEHSRDWTEKLTSYNMNEKISYNKYMKQDIDLLYEMFFEKFKFLYKTMRGIN